MEHDDLAAKFVEAYAEELSFISQETGFGVSMVKREAVSADEEVRQGTTGEARQTTPGDPLHDTSLGAAVVHIAETSIIEPREASLPQRDTSPGDLVEPRGVILPQRDTSPRDLVEPREASLAQRDASPREQRDSDTQTFEANATAVISRRDLMEFRRVLNDSLAKDDISPWNPNYEGSFQVLRQETLLNYQLKDGLRSHQDALQRDKKGRILVARKRLAHILVAIHTQNGHNNFQQDLRALADFKLLNVTKIELRTCLKTYRAMCLHCQRRPHAFRRPLLRTLYARKPRAILLMFRHF